VKTEFLTESKPTELTLTDHEADQLRWLGSALASRKGWWGESDGPKTDIRSVIQCDRVSDDCYNVKVSDSVGAIGVGDLQLIVRPKIPLSHLIFLLAEADQLPRSLYERSRLSADDTFFDVIANWFVDTCEALLRQGLTSDYGRITGDLPCARGRIHVVKTSRALSRGRPSVHCDFDHFGEDTGLNRVIKAAALRLLRQPALPGKLHERCRRIVYRLSDIGELRVGDLSVKPDALSSRYRDAHPLALSILSSTGIDLDSGGTSAWTFLFRTPESVEEGLRNTLQRHLQPDCAVRKTGKVLLGDRRRSLNPDLVFGDNEAVGDIKYRLANSNDLERSDANQVTAFATAYRVDKAAIIAFGHTDDRRPAPWAAFGPVRVNGFSWNCDEAFPERAAINLAEQLREWLDG